jgi:hypothetical protein
MNKNQMNFFFFQNKFVGANPIETNLTSSSKTSSVQSVNCNSIDLNKVKIECLLSIRPKSHRIESSGYSQRDAIVIEDSDDEQSSCSERDDNFFFTVNITQ